MNTVIEETLASPRSDLSIARAFVSKAESSKSRGIEFDLSFTAYKNLMRAKKCKISGVCLSDSRPQKELRATDRTIDRIDANKGYVSGNVMAVCHAVNSFKSIFENQAHNKIVTPKIGMKILKKMLDEKGGTGRVVEIKAEKVGIQVLP